MDYIDDIVNDLDQLAVAEIMKYNIPTLDNYNDVVSVAIEICKRLNANLSEKLLKRKNLANTLQRHWGLLKNFLAIIL